ncbi:MAG: hypothetical protein MJZ02_09135, partial [Paludibacteraceae bacterium]|nr:hypothetical protein [Paludibacteraceae bacterium]
KGKEEGLAEGLEKGEAIGLEKGEAIGLEKGEAIGLEKGVQLTKIKNARNLKNLGIAIDIIAKATGLSSDEIKKL